MSVENIKIPKFEDILKERERAHKEEQDKAFEFIMLKITEVLKNPEYLLPSTPLTFAPFPVSHILSCQTRKKITAELEKAGWVARFEEKSENADTVVHIEPPETKVLECQDNTHQIQQPETKVVTVVGIGEY